MSTPITKSNLISTAMLSVIVALVGYQTFGHDPAPAAAPSQPTIVATFDLERTFNTIDQKKAAFAKITELAEKLQSDADAMRKELEQLSANLDIHPKGSPKAIEAQEKLEYRTAEYRAKVEWIKLKLEAEKGRALKRIYFDIRKAVQEFAEKQNYSVVLVDDSVAEIPPGTLEDLNRQISARRIVYTNADITDALIDHMNVAFKASGGVVPAAANPPAAPSKPATPGNNNKK
jgi:Skp family chaperone for outer membrane proteins